MHARCGLAQPSLSLPLGEICSSASASHGQYTSIVVIVGHAIPEVRYLKSVSSRSRGDQERRRLHLVTLGDAVAGFLDERDEHKQGLDISTMKTFQKGWPIRPY
jgi:hypothetical protein